MKKILVTGGAGFIGSHVVDLLAEQGKKIIIVDNLSSGSLENVQAQNNVELIQADVTKREALEAVFVHNPDIEGVIHLAAQSKVGPSLENPLFDATINIDGTIELLELSRRNNVKNFIYASSAAVYGPVERLPVTEDTPRSPLSPYGVSKLAAEEYVKAYGRLYPMRTTSLRFANVFGPRQSAATEAGVITIFIEQLLKGETPVIFGDGEQTRDFVYVKDVAKAVVAALATPTHAAAVYNVSTATETSIAAMLEAIGNILGTPIKPQFAEERPGDIRYSYLANKQIKTALNWEPEVSLTAGLAETLNYFQK